LVTTKPGKLHDLPDESADITIFFKEMK
jgi:hypothetical protein